MSLDRGKGMNREVDQMYFELLFSVMQEIDLLDKPDHIFNMDKTGLQLKKQNW